jgi:hypothetical protein
VLVETAVGIDGGRWWGGVYEVTVVVGFCNQLCKRGQRFLAKSLKPSPSSSVSGVAVETVVGIDGRRWWGGAYKTMAVVEGCV